MTQNKGDFAGLSSDFPFVGEERELLRRALVQLVEYEETLDIEDTSSIIQDIDTYFREGQ